MFCQVEEFIGTKQVALEISIRRGDEKDKGLEYTLEVIMQGLMALR